MGRPVGAGTAPPGGLRRTGGASSFAFWALLTPAAGRGLGPFLPTVTPRSGPGRVHGPLVGAMPAAGKDASPAGCWVSVSEQGQAYSLRGPQGTLGRLPRRPMDTVP